MRLDRILFTLLSIPSPPGGEQATSRFCARFLAERGFLVEADRLGNVAAKRGHGPIIVLAAHLDDWGDPFHRRFRVLPEDWWPRPTARPWLGTTSAASPWP